MKNTILRRGLQSPNDIQSAYLHAKDIPVGGLRCGRGIHRSGGSCQRCPRDVWRDGVEAASGGAPVGAEGGGLSGFDVTSDGAMPGLAHELTPVEDVRDFECKNALIMVLSLTDLSLHN